MEKSQTLTRLAQAVTAFRIKVATIKKDAKNPFFNSSYATLSNILEAIQVPLEETGLTFIQMPDGDNLITILIHDDGEFIQSVYPINPGTKTPQAVGSAITYARRYSLTAILGLNIEEDDDGNAATQTTTNGQAEHKPDADKPEDKRPWLTEKQFNSAMERITNGAPELFAKIKSEFKMKKQYYQELYNAAKNVG